MATWGHILSPPIHNIRQKRERLWGDWIQPVYNCDLWLQNRVQISHRAGKCKEPFQNQLPTEVRDTDHACIITLHHKRCSLSINDQVHDNRKKTIQEFVLMLDMDLLPWPPSELTQEMPNKGLTSNISLELRVNLKGFAADNILNIVSWPNWSRSRDLPYERQQQLFLT